MGYTDWDKIGGQYQLPYNPQHNGLRYLADYNRTAAHMFLTSPSWTRAVFVRDPATRCLSAYLDKAAPGRKYFARHCGGDSVASFADFVAALPGCPDQHWRPQYYRMEAKYWPHINFVGRMEHWDQDVTALLQRVGVSPDFLLETSKTKSRFHATNATTRLHDLIKNNKSLLRAIEEYYRLDYEMDLFGFEQLSDQVKAV